MRLVRLGTALVLVSAAALALPASAADPGCYRKTGADGQPTGPQYCSQAVWMHQGATKVGNLAATGQTPAPSWNTTKPTASATTGAGAGYATNGAARQTQGPTDPATGSVFRGTYTGALDTLDLTFYLAAPGKQMDPTYYAGVVLTVDGKKVLDSNIDGLPLSPGGSAALKTSFVLAGLGQLLTEAGVADSETAQHAIQLDFSAYTVATGTAVVLYDSSEVPSGMVFNTTAPLDGRFVIGGDTPPEEG